MIDQEMRLPKIGKLYKVTSWNLAFLRPGYIVMPFRINPAMFSDSLGQPVTVIYIDVLAVKFDETGAACPFTVQFKAYDGGWRELLTEAEDQHHEESKEPDKLIS